LAADSEHVVQLRYVALTFYVLSLEYCVSIYFLCITGSSRFCSKMCQVWNVSVWYV